MGKPDIEVFETFKKRYFELSAACGKEQYLVPYLMSSHPGSTLKEAVELALYLKKWDYSPEQVQDYYPTPGTASTVMFYTGLDPFTMQDVFVPTDYEEKQMQRALLQYKKPENADLVRKALIKCGRGDLIGFGKECLVRPQGGTMHPTGSSSHQHGTHNRSKSAASHMHHHSDSAEKRKTASPSKKGWAKAKVKTTGTKKKK